jgi:hypothetical protein
MITVEMAIGEGNRDEMEKWFWRAMDADNDNLDACNKKLLWLEPKWHGSPEEMLEFARTCRNPRIGALGSHSLWPRRITDWPVIYPMPSGLTT